MRKCPACGALYDEATEVICTQCGVDLPAPYENWDDEEEADDGYDQGEFANPLPVRGLAGEVLAALGITIPATSDPLSNEYRPEQLTILSGATVYLGEEIFSPGTLVIGAGRILEVIDAALPDPHNGATYYNLSGMLLTAGFIDNHVHGMMGINTNEARVEDFQHFSHKAAMHGVTSLVPTTVACSVEELRQVLENLRDARTQGTPGARLLGLHLESNFISQEFKGAQPPGSIFPPTDPRADAILQTLDEFKDEVRIVTLAPELPGALELIAWLLERDIVVSLGHSAATYEQTIAAIEAGATQATHLFNAMSPLHHRNPGLVGAALERDEVFTEMVCDGVHVHPAVISTVISAKGAERFIPVSDGLQGAGMQEGEFFLGGQHVTVREGVARLDSGTIAGSITTMDHILQFLVNRVGWDLGEALTMVATTPADGLEVTIIGRIAQGAVADLTVLSPELEVQMTLVEGKVVYRKEQLVGNCSGLS